MREMHVISAVDVEKKKEGSTYSDSEIQSKEDRTEVHRGEWETRSGQEVLGILNRSHQTRP